MFGGINPKKMQGMMKQLGIAQEEIEAERVIIEKADGKIIINNPRVVKIKMQGQESFQITGEVSVSEGDEEGGGVGVSEEDIKQVSEKTGKSEDEARKALEDSNGDLAEAILALS